MSAGGGILATIFQWLAYTIYNASPQVATSGQPFPMQCDAQGNLLVSIAPATSSATLVPTGAPLTPANNGTTMPTGNLARWVDLSTGSVQVYLAPGSFDGEQKLFVVMNAVATSNATFTLNTVGGTNTIVYQGAPAGSFAQCEGLSSEIALTWCAAALSGAGEWIG